MEILSQVSGRIHSEITSRWLAYFPRSVHLSYFDSFLVLNVLLFSILIVAECVLWIKKRTSYKTNQLPPITDTLKNCKNATEFLKQRADNLPAPEKKPVLRRIPYKEPLKISVTDYEAALAKKKISGVRFAPRKHCDLVSQLCKQYCYSNPLHFDVHPFTKQMEVECLHIVSRILNYPPQLSNQDEICGSFNEGSNQSVFLMLFAYRECAYKSKGIARPNIVASAAGNPTVFKACEYLGIQLKLVELDKAYVIDIGSLKAAIDDDTICVIASAPNSVYGAIDPVETIAAICIKKQIAFHLDMSIGGFLLPFLKDDSNRPVFTVPKGVTSVHVDMENYALGLQGASVLLYSDRETWLTQFFVTSYWPGGLYGTVGFQGSRSGLPIVSSWTSILKTGLKGYREQAQQIRIAALNLTHALRELGYVVCGESGWCIITFYHPTLPVSMLHSELLKNSWELNVVRGGLRLVLTQMNCTKASNLVSILKKALEMGKPVGKAIQFTEIFDKNIRLPTEDVCLLTVRKALDAVSEVETSD